jgi:hypothetical protein
MFLTMQLPNPMTTINIKITHPKPSKNILELPPKLRKKDIEQPSFRHSTTNKAYRTFQITPHAQVKNEKIDQFADIIAGSYQEIYERFHKGKLVDPDRIFFETVMTNKSFKTYINTNDHLSETVKQQASLIWKDVTLNEVVDNHLDLDTHNTDGYELKLKFPYFLSLKTDRRLTEMPLAELLEASRFMQEEDQVTIQFGIQAAEDDWYKDAEDDRKYFEKKKPRGWKPGKELNKSSDTKITESGFDFVLRITVSSPDPRRRKRLGRGITLALKQLNLDNELCEKQVKPVRMKKWLDDMQNYRIKVPWLFGKRNLITCSEIAHFIKLPQRNLQIDYPIIDKVSKPEMMLPDELFLDVPGINIGKVIEKGKEKTARIPVTSYGSTDLKYVLDAYCLPEFVFGEMGSGKTGEAIHRAYSAIRLGQAAFFFDTADGAAAKELHDSLPEDYPKEKIIHIDATNKAWPIALTGAFSISNQANNEDDELQAEQAKEAGKMFLRQFVGGMATSDFTNRMDRYLSAAARAVGADPLEIELALTSPSYREELMTMESIKSQRDIMMELESLQDKAKRGSDDISVDGILSRLRALSSDRFRTNLFYQIPKEKLRFRHYADNPEGGYGYCVTIYCDKNSFGPDGQEAIMTYLLAKVLLEGAYSRVDIPQIDRKPFVVILDEPHRFIKGDMATKLGEDAAVELRKYRCKLVMMNHSRAQLGRMWDAFESGGIQVTMYKSKNVKAFQEMAPIISPLDPEEAWSSLGQHEAVVTRKLPSKKEVSFICKMTPPPDSIKDRSKRREECARQFGRPWKEVSEEIQDRRLLYMEKDREWYQRMEQSEKEAKEMEKEERKKSREEAKKSKKEEDNIS